MKYAPALVVLALAVASVYALAVALTGGPVGLSPAVGRALAVLWALLPLVAAYGLVGWLLAVLWAWLIRSLR